MFNVGSFQWRVQEFVGGGGENQKGFLNFQWGPSRENDISD